MPYEEGGHQKKKYPNSGVLFRNEEKEDPRHKDFGGNGVMSCPYCQAEIELWLSAWIKDSSKTGKQFLSVSLDPKIQSDKRRFEGAKKAQQSIDAADILRPILSSEKAAPQGGVAGPSTPPTRRVSGPEITVFDDLPSSTPGTLDFDDDIPF